MTFAILTDSTADLDQNWAKEHQVTILGLTIELDGTVYQTVGEGQLTSPELLESMKNGAKPTTSQVNVGQFQETFKHFAKEGKAVLYVAFSSVLSGTYQSAVMARDLVLEDYPEAVIEIVDPKAAGIGEGYLVMRAVAARDAGRSLAEAKEEIMDLAPKLRTYFLVDDLYHLMRGGRLSKSAAIMGSLASIKPILWIDAEGKLVPISKVRGRKKAVRELLELIKADIGESTALVSYTNDLEGAEALKQEMLALEGIDEVFVMPLGPVISAHVGPNSLIGFVIGKENRK
ncbi:DegV family protein [Streptococcus parasanguinis]|uniref:DegV family protein n=1 Tax=Streptococcus parasanguinis TaxID=1318 RepID=UPI0005F349B8|nr:DegV family protein [Streptococcus parasanguinis]KJU88502.1 DegV family protein [Streptococcus parasanguinis]